jgi:hypothetical protein
MVSSPTLRSRLALTEAFAFAYDTLLISRARTPLAGLGIILGTAALILVVTISLTGKQYVR